MKFNSRAQARLITAMYGYPQPSSAWLRTTSRRAAAGSRKNKKYKTVPSRPSDAAVPRLVDGMKPRHELRVVSMESLWSQANGTGGGVA